MVVQDSVKLITNGWIDADAPLRGSSRQDDQNRARFSSSLFYFSLFIHSSPPSPSFFFLSRSSRLDRVNMKSRERVESRSTAAMDTTTTPRDVYEMISPTQWHLDPGGITEGVGVKPNEPCFNNETPPFFPPRFAFDKNL